MSITEDRRLEQADAITFALRGEWQAAIDANIVLLKAHPNDIETLNRLAKACFEINQPVAVYPSHYRPDAELAIDSESEPQHRNNVLVAREIYEYVLSISSSNVVARKMLVLIERTNAHNPKQRTFMDMRNFVIETGTSTITSIHVDAAGTLDLVPGEIVKLRVVGAESSMKAVTATAKAVKAKPKDPELQADGANVASAQPVTSKREDPELQADGANVASAPPVNPESETTADTTGIKIPDDATAIDVYDSNDLLIGRLDPSLALRIIRFMRQRNIYEAAVWRFSDHQQHIEIIVREVYAHPDNRNEVSFPGKLVEENERRMIVDDVEDDDAADDAEEEEITEETDSDTYAGDDDEEHERLESLDQSANDDSENED